MAAPAIGLRQRFAPPATARVDWSHPLAQGLMFAWSPAHEIDWAGQIRPTRLGAMVQVPTAFGLGAQASSPSVRTGWSIPGSQFPSQNNGTMFAAGSGPAINLRMLWDTDTDRFTTYMNNPAFTVLFLANSAFVDSGVNPAGIHTIGQSCAGGTTTGFVNGIGRGSTAHTIGTRGANGFLMARISGATDNWSTPIAIMCGWSRALSAAEHAAMHADPFCFLRW